jgi:hypothetical protein
MGYRRRDDRPRSQRHSESSSARLLPGVLAVCRRSLIEAMAPIIPQQELNDLDTAVDEAVGLAAEGELAAGYTRLLTGLHHAQELRHIGAPWARALIRHYQQAIRVYIESLGVPMEEPQQRQHGIDETRLPFCWCCCSLPSPFCSVSCGRPAPPCYSTSRTNTRPTRLLVPPEHGERRQTRRIMVIIHSLHQLAGRRQSGQFHSPPLPMPSWRLSRSQPER